MWISLRDTNTPGSKNAFAWEDFRTIILIQDVFQIYVCKDKNITIVSHSRRFRNPDRKLHHFHDVYKIITE